MKNFIFYYNIIKFTQFKIKTEVDCYFNICCLFINVWVNKILAVLQFTLG